MRNGRWYLYAVDDASRGRRTFAFPRISNAGLAGEKFSGKRISPSACFRYSFGVVAGEHPPKENVILEFSPDVAIRISETVWHPEQILNTMPDGRVRLSLPLAEPCYLELKPWLLSWGPTVKVIAPQSLQNDHRESVRAMAKAAGILKT
jgi:predicted DNA-binding transcriptional regulator YafY